MIHYHGGPITPMSVLYTLAGKHLCVSFARAEQIARVQEISQSMMIDNGAWHLFQKAMRAGLVQFQDWPLFYAFCEKWLRSCDWAVIPDVIDGGSQLQDALLKEWPLPRRLGAPVWHLDEPVHRLVSLCEGGWNRVCMGSTAEYFVILSDAWRRRMDQAWNELARVFGRYVPPVHMLRGMQLSGKHWPFASVDSTDVAQNHNRPQNTARAMADRWDALQCPSVWNGSHIQVDFFEEAAS